MDEFWQKVSHSMGDYKMSKLVDNAWKKLNFIFFFPFPYFGVLPLEKGSEVMKAQIQTDPTFTQSRLNASLQFLSWY